MYQDLGHLVALAEKWLVDWSTESMKRTTALQFVRMYMITSKDPDWYSLPSEVRLQKLGAFMANLKLIGMMNVSANKNECLFSVTCIWSIFR